MVNEPSVFEPLKFYCILKCHILSVLTFDIPSFFFFLRKALLHGKHVLVEFPVATSATVTKELFALADEKGRSYRIMSCIVCMEEPGVLGSLPGPVTYFRFSCC